MYDLVEIDTRNLSRNAMLKFLRLALLLTSRKFIKVKLWLSFARTKLVKLVKMKKKLTSSAGSVTLGDTCGATLIQLGPSFCVGRHFNINGVLHMQNAQKKNLWLHFASLKLADSQLRLESKTELHWGVGPLRKTVHSKGWTYFRVGKTMN